MTRPRPQDFISYNAFTCHYIPMSIDPPVSHFFDPMLTVTGHRVQARSGESSSPRQIANASTHIYSAGYKLLPQHTSRWQPPWLKSDRNSSEGDPHQVRIVVHHLAIPLTVGESLRSSWTRSAYEMVSQSSLRWSTLSNRRTN
jgi:hypothetical protein